MDSGFLTSFLESWLSKGTTFIGEFISSGDEEIKSLVQIKIKVTVEMAADEIVNLLFRHRMEILHRI